MALLMYMMASYATPYFKHWRKHGMDNIQLKDHHVLCVSYTVILGNFDASYFKMQLGGYLVKFISYHYFWPYSSKYGYI